MILFEHCDARYARDRPEKGRGGRDGNRRGLEPKVDSCTVWISYHLFYERPSGAKIYTALSSSDTGHRRLDRSLKKKKKNYLFCVEKKVSYENCVTQTRLSLLATVQTDYLQLRAFFNNANVCFLRPWMCHNRVPNCVRFSPRIHTLSEILINQTERPSEGFHKWFESKILSI